MAVIGSPTGGECEGGGEGDEDDDDAEDSDAEDERVGGGEGEGRGGGEDEDEEGRKMMNVEFEYLSSSSLPSKCRAVVTACQIFSVKRFKRARSRMQGPRARMPVLSAEDPSRPPSVLSICRG